MAMTKKMTKKMADIQINRDVSWEYIFRCFSRNLFIWIVTGSILLVVRTGSRLLWSYFVLLRSFDLIWETDSEFLSVDSILPSSSA
jgi:hypothetical protein